MIIGRNIKKLRIERKLSLRQLAKKSDIPSFSYIRNIEEGIVEDPGIKTVIKIAKALEISIDDLVKDVK